MSASPSSSMARTTPQRPSTSWTGSAELDQKALATTTCRPGRRAAFLSSPRSCLTEPLTHR
eukprot:7518346-Pyramimonas_sp.AAC.1